MTDHELVRPVLPFLINPYLQLGNNSDFDSQSYLELIWHLQDDIEALGVEVKYQDSNQWQQMPILDPEKIKISGIKKHYRFKSILSNLRYGKAAEYRILWRGYTVFAATFRTPKGSGMPLKFTVVGDLADGGNEVKQVIHRINSIKPDLCLIAGDVTYKDGLVSEYLENFFPVLNSNENDPEFGAPLLRSVPTIVAWGNHDVSLSKKETDTKRRSDALGIDLFFSQPRNGPSCKLKNKSFKKMAKILGNGFLSRSNYSLKMGNALFQIIDGNEYMDWQNPELRLWLSQSLSRSDCVWKFVIVHHPPFNIDKKYWCQQHLRMLTSIFEGHGVDVVFSGHSHMYSRSHPLRYHAEAGGNGKFIQKDGHVSGKIIIDKQIDKTKPPIGPVYITTGAGGKPLRGSHAPDISSLPDFLAFADTENRSVTVCQIEGRKLTLRQISSDGEEIDSIIIEKHDQTQQLRRLK